MGNNLSISRGMSEISSFGDSYFLATQAKIWIFYLPSTPKHMRRILVVVAKTISKIKKERMLQLLLSPEKSLPFTITCL